MAMPGGNEMNVIKTSERERQYSREYHIRNREAICARKRMHEANKTDAERKKKNERNRMWCKANPEKSRAHRRKQQLKPQIKAGMTLAYISRGIMKRGRHRFSETIGCTGAQFRAHIESLFSEGMTWENYGQWELDHLIPRSAFDLTDIAQARACFNWQNVQPLWKSDNIKKGSAKIGPMLEFVERNAA